MKYLKLLVVFVLLSVMSFKQASDSDKLNAIIAKYEAERNYEFKRNESLESTIKYYQAESDFAKNLKEELEKVPVENLSETEKISRELLLFVLQDDMDTNTYKMYLNTITNESAFHLNLSRMGNRSFENIEQVKMYLKLLDGCPKLVDYNLNLLRAAIKEGMAKIMAVFISTILFL